MIHGDIKPDNIGIKITDTGTIVPCLIDIDGVVNKINVRYITGTEWYSPPETQHHDVTSKYLVEDTSSVRSSSDKIDLYSCGKTFEHILYGFYGDNFEDISSKSYFLQDGIFLRKHKLDDKLWLLIQQDLYPFYRFLKMFQGYTTVYGKGFMFSLTMCDTLRKMTNPNFESRCSIDEALNKLLHQNVYSQYLLLWRVFQLYMLKNQLLLKI